MLYYVYDIEGIEAPEGPYSINEANEQLKLKGQGWNIINEETAKQIYTYLEEDHL